MIDMRNTMIHLAILAGTAALAFSQTPQAMKDPQDPIVTTEFVKEAIGRGAIVWDIRWPADFRAAHIPDAINDGPAFAMLTDTNSGDYLPPEKLAESLGAAGLDPAGEIIVYGAKGSAWSYYARTSLMFFGYGNVRVFHGGIDDWKSAGNTIDTGAAPLRPKTISINKTPGNIVWNDGVLARVRSGKSQILDVRTPKEYNGEDIRSSRGGHIPGAVNIPYETNWLDPEAAVKLREKKIDNRDGMALNSKSALKRLYAGLKPDVETIVYCQSGVRASNTATILESIGFTDVKVYEPSWSGYAEIERAAAENETVRPDTAAPAAIGYSCPPCGCVQDETIHETAGGCPECSMPMIALTDEMLEVDGIYNFMRVNDSVWTGGQPLMRHLPKLKTAGIETVINLRMPGEHDSERETAVLDSLGIDYFNIPVDYSNPAPEYADKFLALTDAAMAKGPVFIHCTAAIRVGAFWAIRRVKRDAWTLDEALAEARNVGLTDQSGWVNYVRDYVKSK